MDKKKVMGHNPLGKNHLADAKFDFIPFTESGSVHKESVAKLPKTKKRVVSYYLEEDLINAVKNKATSNEESFSHYVSRVLKNAVKD
jgi:predicted DNA binding CopG/RHH family protein